MNLFSITLSQWIKFIPQLEDGSLLDRYDTASARAAETLWYTEEIIKFKRSIKMSGFYQVRWEGEWLCGLRGQVNYSEVDCAGVLVRRSGLDNCIVPPCHNCISLFYSCFVHHQSGEKRPEQAMGLHPCIRLYSQTPSQISLNVLKGTILSNGVICSLNCGGVFGQALFSFSDMNQRKLRVCQQWLMLRSQGRPANFPIHSQSEILKILSLISNPQEPWKNQNTVSMSPTTCLFSPVVG